MKKIYLIVTILCLLLTFQIAAADDGNIFSFLFPSDNAAKSGGDPTLSLPKGIEELSYEGKDVYLVKEGSTPDGTFQYALGEAPEGSATAPTNCTSAESCPAIGTNSWSDNVPTATDAGTYYVYWYVKGDSNHNDTAPQCLEVKINPATITVTEGVTAENKTYDGNTDATLVFTNATLAGNVDSSNVTVTGTGTFESASVGNNKTVTISNLALSGTRKDNYILAESGHQTTTTANITAKSAEDDDSGVTVTKTSDETFTYDGTGKAPTLEVKAGDTTLTSGTDYTITYEGVSPTAYDSSEATPTDAGTYKAVVTFINNYSGSKSVEFIIGKKALTITAKAQTIVYGSSLDSSASQVEAVGLVDGDSITSITLTPSTTNVTSNGTITPSDAATTKGAGNYTITYYPKTLTITQKDANADGSGVTAAQQSDETLVYNGSANAPTLVVKDGDTTLTSGTDYTVKYEGVSPTTYTSSTTAPTNAGNYKAVVEFKGNYSGSKEVEFSIGTQALTVTANAQEITYGGSITQGTDWATASGLVTGDNLTAVTLTANNTDVTDNGTITPSAAETTNGISNYNVTYSDGTLKITAKSADAAGITVEQKSGETLVYTGSANAPTLEVKDGDTILISGTDYTVKYEGISPTTYGPSTTAPANAGDYKAVVEFKGNYSGSKDAAFSIAKMALTVTAKDQEITYGGSISQNTDQAASEGLVSGDSLTGIVLTPSTTAATNDGKITPSAAATAKGAENYEISYKDGKLVINKAAFDPSDLTDGQKPTANSPLTYDGTPKELVNEPAGTLPDGYTKVQYSTDDGETWSDDIPTGTDAGDHTVKVKYVGDDNHEDFTGEDIIVTIDKKSSNDSADLTAKLKDGQEFTYDGNPKTPELEVKDGTKDLTKGTDYTVTYKGDATTTYGPSETAPTDAGNYIVVVNFTGNYEGTKEVEFEIRAASSDKDNLTSSQKPTAKSDLTYKKNETTKEGEPQPLVEGPSELPSGYTKVQYSMDDVTWSDEIPTGTNADEYTVYVKYIGDSNHNDFEGDSITVTISKANPDYQAPTGGTLTYSGSNQSLVTAGVVKALEEEVLEGLEISGESVELIESAELIEEIAAETISKDAAEVVDPSGLTLDYTGKAQNLVTKGTTNGGTMLYALGDESAAPADGWSEDVPTAVNVGIYYIWWQIEGDDNFYSVEPDYVVTTIVKRPLDPSMIILSIEEVTFNGLIHEVSINVSAPGLEDSDWELTDDSQTSGVNVGTYSVCIRVSENSTNFTSVDGEPVCTTWEIKAVEPPNTIEFYQLWTPEVLCDRCSLPATGFSSKVVTNLREMPTSVSYKNLGLNIQIPSLGVDSEVVEIPLVENEWPVEWLGSSLGMLSGSARPGEGYTFIAGHNTLNSTEYGPFALLSTLEVNDTIMVTDAADGALKLFKVYANELVSPDGFAEIGAIAADNPGSLVLLTCENESIDGGYLNRRVVFAAPVGK